MADNIFTRMRQAWNVFTNNDPYGGNNWSQGVSYSMRPDRPILTGGNERSIITSIYNRISLDVAAINFKHVKLDEHQRYSEDYESGLNTCLNLEANIDQTGQAFIQDAVLTMLDQGTVALCPIDTDVDPRYTDSYDILSMRTGKIIEWEPRRVRVEVYNDRTGKKEQIWFAKNKIGIIQNPFFSVMNERNSTMQRLRSKMSLLDRADEKNLSGKLDIIIQLPYVIKTEAKRAEAEKRRKDIEMQLTSSKYGVAYTDGTEKIVQLNRPLENNLLDQITKLKEELFAQLGITQEILNGSANEETMLNYTSRVIEPIADALVNEFNRKFLTKTARSQHQAVFYFNEPFKLVPVSKIADIADKFTRNEIMTSNEIRQIVGMKPSADPNADTLRNKNLNQASGDNAPQQYDVDGNPIQQPRPRVTADTKVSDLSR